VGNESQMEELARKAVERFGRIDIWINNAGVGAVGLIEDVPSDVFERLIKTNLFGVVYGTKAAIKQMKQQDRGLIINIASQLGKMGLKYYWPYAISKFGVVALGQSVRQELLDHNIDCCTVMPATIDTPFFQHSGTYAGRKLKAMPPIHTVDDVLKTIFGLVQNPKREVFVGNSGRAMHAMNLLAPGKYEKFGAYKMDKDHLEKSPHPNTPGAVFEPMQEGSGIDGGWARRERMKKLGKLAMVAAVAAPLLALKIRGQRLEAAEEIEITHAA
jgi:short-subunit dehydrogenase